MSARSNLASSIEYKGLSESKEIFCYLGNIMTFIGNPRACLLEHKINSHALLAKSFCFESVENEFGLISVI